MNICGIRISSFYFYFSLKYFKILENNIDMQCLIHICFINIGFSFCWTQSHYKMCQIQYNRNPILDGSAFCDGNVQISPSIVLLPFSIYSWVNCLQASQTKKHNVLLCKVGRRLLQLCALQRHWLATSISVIILWLTVRKGGI